MSVLPSETPPRFEARHGSTHRGCTSTTTMRLDLVLTPQRWDMASSRRPLPCVSLSCSRDLSLSTRMRACRTNPEMEANRVPAA